MYTHIMKVFFVALLILMPFAAHAQLSSQQASANAKAKKMTFTEINDLQLRVTDAIPPEVATFTDRYFSRIESWRQKTTLSILVYTEQTRRNRNVIFLNDAPMLQNESVEQKESFNTGQRFGDNLRWIWLLIVVVVMTLLGYIFILPIVFYVVSLFVIGMFVRFAIKAFSGR